jgi:hypothetical protein
MVRPARSWDVPADISEASEPKQRRLQALAAALLDQPAHVHNGQSCARPLWISDTRLAKESGAR